MKTSRDYGIGLEFVKQAVSTGINDDGENKFIHKLVARYEKEIVADESFLFGDILTAILYLNRQVTMAHSDNKELVKKIENYDKIILDQNKKFDALETDLEQCITHIEALEKNLRCLRESAVRGDAEIDAKLSMNLKAGEI